MADLAVFLSGLRFLNEPLTFDPCCLMSPPPPPLFPPPPQLWKRGIPVGAHSHTPACINTPHLPLIETLFLCFLIEGWYWHVGAKCFWRRGAGKTETCDTWVFTWTPRTSRTPGPRGKELFPKYYTMFETTHQGLMKSSIRQCNQLAVEILLNGNETE